MDAGSFLDLVEVDAASNTGVDNVRSLIDTVRFQPVAGSYKVYIIDEAHMLSKGAWNALLKTLEEPPSHTVFILATTESGKVPATINSRAQRFDFVRFSEAQLVSQLQSVLEQEGAKLRPDAVELVAHNAEGGMRDALTLLDQVLSLGENPELADIELLLGVTSRGLILELLNLIQLKDAAGLPDFFTKLSERYFDMQAVNRDILEVLRELLVVRLTSKKDISADLVLAADWFGENDLIFLIRQFLRSYKDLSSTPEPSLPLLVVSIEAALRSVATVPPLPQQGATQSPVSTPQAPAKQELAQAQKPTVSSVERFAAAPQKDPQVVASIDPSVVSARWGEVCDRLKDINGPLATLVRNSPICAVTEGGISLGVKYLFHKEQLESTKNRQLISDSIAAIFGTPMRVTAQFVEREESSTNPVVALSDALKIFGGELVE
jgi:DNA polymerase-3 subunit gamma/tau